MIGWSIQSNRIFETKVYRTADEIDYIAMLERRRNAEALEVLARHVRSRKWDAGVDVDAVAAAVQMALSRLKGAI